MKICCFWLVSLGTVLMSGTTSHAFPTSGANCASCHSPVTGRMSLSGETTTTDLGAGLFKTYNVAPGNTVTITENVLNGSVDYAASVRNFEQGGQQNPGNFLVYTTPNLALNGWNGLVDPGSGATYYSTSVISDGSTPSFNFDISVNPATPLDYYELIFTMAGSNFLPGGRFAQEEHVYLNVVPEPQAYALATGLCLVGFAAYRRLGGKARSGE
jgi:hypothetical protein